MTTKYSWTFGEIALAKVTKTFYAKVKVVKNDEGIFHDEKVLGISTSDNGDLQCTMILCYYVEICRSKICFWLPYTCLHLAERSRPFYGPADKTAVPKPIAVPKKRKILEDNPLPLNAIKHAKLKSHDLNVTLELRQLPFKQDKRENAFKDFIRRGKEMIFDDFYFSMQGNYSKRDDYDYIMNIDASTEDKFATVIKNIMSYKEVKSYLQQCWRFITVSKEIEVVENSDSSSTSPTKAQSLVHTTWCLVCGKRQNLVQCEQCPSSFHSQCRKQWLVTIIHRKQVQYFPETDVTKIKKILSSTRTITSKTKAEEPDLCPSCMWGPNVGYGDVVWHKLGSCPWWPAKVLSPGTLPSCLVSRRHAPQQWPVKYYGTLNHSWGDRSRMCLFLPSHTAALDENKAEDLQDAVLDACDDYICVYLT